MPELPPRLGPIRRALLLRALDGRLPRAIAGRVHARIGADPVWRGAYDAMRQAERASLSGAPSAGQHAMLEHLVMGSVDGPAGASGRRAAVGLLAAAACVAVVVVIAQPGDDLRARSAAPDPSTERVGVRVRCVDAADATRVRAETVLSAVGDGVPFECAPGSLLVFSTTNLAEAPVHVFVMGVRSDGEPLWYAPFDRDGGSVAIAPGTTNHVLDVAAETAGMTTGDKVTLFGLFSDRPLTAGALEAQLDGARQRGVAIGAVDRLPVAGVRQGRAAMRVPGGDVR